MSCSTIRRGSVIETCEVPEAGTRARLILINYDDIGRIYTNDEGKIINIILKSETTGGIDFDFELDAEFTEGISDLSAYEFTGFRNDVKKYEEVVKRDQSKSRFIHATSFVIYDITQLQKTNIKNLARGRVVAIVESKGKSDDSIEVLGKECGLQIVDGLIRSAYENTGAFVLSLSTPDNDVEFERKLPQTLGIDYDHGQSIIDHLLNLNPTVEKVFDDSFDDTFE